MGESAKNALCGGGDMHVMHSVLCVVLVRSFSLWTRRRESLEAGRPAVAIAEPVDRCASMTAETR